MGLVSVFLDEWVNTHVCTSSCRIHACVCATLQVQTHTYTCTCLNDDVGKFLMRARDLGDENIWSDSVELRQTVCVSQAVYA